MPRGSAYKKLGQYEEAIADYWMSLQHAQQVKYPDAVAAATANLGEVHLPVEDYKTALAYQLQTVAVQKELGNRLNLTENYGHISRTYKRLGDYPAALRYERQARATRDSIASVESDAAMLELRTKYETEKKETLIAL
jgi:two-component system, sensor histidine kinase PdtaS